MRQINKPTRKSNIGRLLSYIKKDIIHKLCNLETEEGQELARYVRYLTQTPTSNRGKKYDGTMINQPDLTVPIISEIPNGKDETAITRDPILIPYAFSDDLLKTDQILIFIQEPIGVFRGSIGKYTFLVRVAYPNSLEKLQPYGDERSIEIFSRVCDMFDSTYTEMDYYDENDNVISPRCKYDIDESTCAKLSKQGYSMRDVYINVTGVSIR